LCYGTLLLVVISILIAHIGFIEASEKSSKGYSAAELERFKRLKEDAEKGKIRPGSGVAYSPKELREHQRKIERQARRKKTPRYKEIPPVKMKTPGYQPLRDYEPPVPYSWLVFVLVFLLGGLLMLRGRGN